jgi:hypothetical protein
MSAGNDRPALDGSWRKIAITLKTLAAEARHIV